MTDERKVDRWPRLMRAETARCYLDFGPEVFRREIVKQLPAIVIRGRRHFDRNDLDRWVDSQLGRATAMADDASDWDSVIDADLQNSGNK